MPAPKPPFESEAKCEVIDMKMIFFILMHIKLFFSRYVLHLASFWKWEFLELRNGLFLLVLLNYYLNWSLAHTILRNRFAIDIEQRYCGISTILGILATLSNFWNWSKETDLSGLTCTCVDFLKARFLFLLVRWPFGLCRLSRNLRCGAYTTCGKSSTCAIPYFCK